jgi:hypothetical protein
LGFDKSGLVRLESPNISIQGAIPMQFDFAGLTVLFGLIAVIGAMLVLKYQAEADTDDSEAGHH